MSNDTPDVAGEGLYGYSDWELKNGHDVDTAVAWLKTIDPELNPENVLIKGTYWRSDGTLSLSIV